MNLIWLAQGGGAAPLSRQEVESILNVQREVLQNSREIKVLVQHNTPNVPAQPNQPAGSQDSNSQQ